MLFLEGGCWAFKTGFLFVALGVLELALCPPLFFFFNRKQNNNQKLSILKIKKFQSLTCDLCHSNKVTHLKKTDCFLASSSLAGVGNTVPTTLFPAGLFLA